MRNSQIVLLSGVGVVLVLIAALVVGFRMIIGSVAEEGAARAAVPPRQSEQAEMLAAELSGFDGLVIRSAWDVQLRQGDEWSVEIDADDDNRDPVNIGVSDGKLVLEAQGRTRRGWFTPGRDMKARITLPDLRSLDVQGVANIELYEFHGESLAVTIAGVGNIEAVGGEFESLDLTISGAGNVDLQSAAITNAAVNLAGAANVELTMDGGELTGSISGIARLGYAGNVSREDVHVSGFSTIERAGH